MTDHLPAICTELHIRYDGHVPVVNSRDVAVMFEKQHHHVLRDIDLIVGHPNLDSLSSTGWFRERKDYHQEARREVRSFDLTKDGFIQLVFKWSGEKAQRIQVRYIKAFNAMEEALRANYLAAMQMDKALATMVEAQAKATQSLQAVEGKVDAFAAYYRPPRLDITDSTKAEHVRALSLMGGRCPCCGRAKVLTEDGQRSPFADFDHFYQNSRRDAAHTWLICKICHKDFTTGRVARSDRTAEFAAYQNKRLRLPGAQPSLF